MTGSSTVAGDAISELCMIYAGMLNIDIYENSRESLPGPLKPYYDINKQYWTKDWEIRNPDGFHCAFYRPVEAQSGGDTDLCPPVLCFRGSDSEPEDFAELAFATQLNLRVFVDMPWPYSDERPGPFNIDKSFSASQEYTDKTMAEMDASGLHREDLFVAQSGREEIFIDGPLAFNANVTVDWTMSAALFYGENGDWAVDFAQGLGRIPAQYTSAIAAGRRAATEAASTWNNRLIMTGHSLGGGLASAAAIAAYKQNPDLTMKVRTFNAAGLHANTARRAGGTLTDAGAIPVRALHVKDEILNSMQSPTPIVPLLAKLMEWGGKTLPPAVHNPTPGRGKSPGAMSISGKTYAPMYSNLPVLYPLERQTLCEPAFSVVTDIVGIANTARTVQQFVDGLIRYLVGRIADDDDLTSGNVDDLKEAFANPVVQARMAALPAEIEDAIMNDAEIPPINLGNSNYLNNTVEPFLNGLVVDLANLAKIILASGEYHTFPPCAFTFLLPRGGGR